MGRALKRSAASVDEEDATPQPVRESVPQTQSSRRGTRSCEGCHHRKIRCDRGIPCINCSRQGVTCVYPTGDPDTAQKPPPTLRDISNRLEQLESLLSRLAERIEVPTGFVADADGGRSRGRGRGYGEPEIQVLARPDRQHPSDRPSDKSTWELLLNNSNVEPLLQEETSQPPQPPLGLETTLSHIQVETTSTSHHRLPTQLGVSAPLDRVSELLDVYPDTQLALRLWDVYVRSVDPVLKILHMPTVQSAVVATILDTRSAQPSTVALTFAIYYAAVTALCHHGCDEAVDLPWEKPVLLKRYQTALDRLLVTPDFINRPDMTGLQALAIYVTCSQANELGRPVWVLNGLVMRLAQSLGLHRDGASLKLRPFESEMRLRLWWHLCVLDSRASEDHGFQPTVDLTNQGLRLPLNVNDDQIYPDMSHFPPEASRWTEMSFSLIQIESCRVLHPIMDRQQQHPGHALLDIREKRKMIQDPVKYMSEKYGIAPGPNSGTPVDLPRIAMQHVTTACKKMEFVLQLREEICMRKQKEAQDNYATPDVLKLSFKLACDALESSHVLLKEGLASRFTWLFSMYTQWYALAYVLRCLCSSPSPRGFEVDRAWALVEGLFPRRPTLQGHPATAAVHDDFGHGRIRKFLNQLRDRAWSLRQHASLTSATNADATADAGDQPPGGPRYWTSQVFAEAATLPPAGTTAAYPGTSTVPGWVPDFTASPDQSFFSSLDLLMPDIPFLPDWNAVINGQ